MIDRFFVLALGLLVASLPFAAWLAADWWKIRPQLRRLAKWARVTYEQTPEYDRQSYAMGAGLFVFFVWWSVAIMAGMP